MRKSSVKEADYIVADNRDKSPDGEKSIDPNESMLQLSTAERSLDRSFGKF